MMREPVRHRLSAQTNRRLRIYPPPRPGEPEPVVITGIGMIASVGHDREAVWRAVRRGESGVRRLANVPGYPSHLRIGAVVEIPPEVPGQLKVTTLGLRAADEALRDAGIPWDTVDRSRFACAVSGHMGDTRWIFDHHGACRVVQPGEIPFWQQWLPNTTCAAIAQRYGLYGPRICHSTACASGVIDFLCAVRAVRDGQCDVALAGSGEGIDPLFAAGFEQMKVLAYDDRPERACRPFDRTRQGFVMGEGAAMFVVERLTHALARGARIYAEVVGGQMLSDAHHVTGLSLESDTLERLISATLAESRLAPRDVGYINAHGTGTELNDRLEIRGIRRALGRAADRVCVSSTKSMLGHLINAAGAVELAITTLALRDGYAPPTLNLTEPDPECDLDCLPQVGRPHRFQHALKLSIAFGGHLVAIALRRWNDVRSGFAYPTAPERQRRAA